MPNPRPDAWALAQELSQWMEKFYWNRGWEQIESSLGEHPRSAVELTYTAPGSVAHLHREIRRHLELRGRTP